MAVQQKQKTPTPRSTRLTVADWVLMVVNLILGGFFATLIPPLIRRLPQNLTEVLVHVAIALATLGYLGASLTLLLRLRRAAAVLEFLCTLAWWCGAAYFWLVTTPDQRLDIGALIWAGGLVLIGVFHLLIASWLWRFRREEEE
ncbi:hypothetical protein [Armatimonas sp.]|uniref:hypothetical protein n=1 Tax=Armatimonas sp. TaxID=1872638 RepID=UPI00286CBE4E|nr:hypothetical protein [Armatimonas sp.]